MQKNSVFVLVRKILSDGTIFYIGIFLVAIWFVYFSVATIMIPYPLEYREGASQFQTQLLLNGENPFSIYNQPLAMNVYGVLYSLAAYPFAFFLGNTLAVYRSINFIFLIFIFLIVSRIAYKNGSDRYIAMACGLIIVIVIPSYGSFGAYPSVMGTFLYISASLIPFRSSFSIKGLWISALLAVLAYYTKPYFVLSFGIVISYIFLFVSKKKGVLYMIIFGLIFTTFYFLTLLVFDFYFIATFWGNIANTSKSFAHMRSQLIQLAMELAPISILTGYFVIENVVDFQLTFKKAINIFQVDIRNFDQPVFLRPLNYFAFWGFCSSLAFIFVLGLHNGANMTYAHQIMLTPLLIWFAQGISLKNYKDKIAKPLILLNMITLSFTFLNISFLSQRNSPEWARLYKYVENSTNILNSPLIVSAMLERNMMPVDSGQTQYYYSIQSPYPQSKLIGPEYSVFQTRGEKYKESISKLIKDKYYDRLLLTEQHWLVNVSDITQNYILADRIAVSMPQVDQNITVEVWEPIK